MIGVDAEPDAGDELDRQLDAGDGGEARHVLLGCTEAGFIAPQQDVRAAVDQHDRVEAQVLDQRTICGAQRLDAGPRKRVDGGRKAVPVEPAAQGEFGEVLIPAHGRGRHLRHVLGQPAVEVEQLKLAEREVGQVHPLAHGEQRQMPAAVRRRRQSHHRRRPPAPGWPVPARRTPAAYRVCSGWPLLGNLDTNVRVRRRRSPHGPGARECVSRGGGGEYCRHEESKPPHRGTRLGWSATAGPPVPPQAPCPRLPSRRRGHAHVWPKQPHPRRRPSGRPAAPPRSP